VHAWQDGHVRRGWVLAIVAACGAKPPKRAETVAPSPAPTTHAPRERSRDDDRVFAERPHIILADYVPDFHEELRWPLSAMSHPELEPQFPIARELAIDVEWEELCTRGVHRRVVAAKADQLEYLRGWCSVLERDINAACRSLGPLMLSNLRGMPEAVRRDLANILVGHGGADAAEGYLQRNLIRDTRVLDLLAASYAEMGKHLDAYAINRLAIDADRSATPAIKCLRLAKHIVLAPDEGDRKFPIEQLHRFVVDRDKADPRCVELADAIACWNSPGDDCTLHFARNNIHMGYRLVAGVYFAWPDGANWHGWWHVGDQLYHALHLPGAVELALTAYEASLVGNSRCEDSRATAIHRAIVEIRAHSWNAKYEPRLQKLADVCPQPAATSSTRRRVRNPRSVTTPGSSPQPTQSTTGP
jgi:hypothetical protein